MAEQAYAYVTLIPVAKGFQKSIAKELGGVGGVGSTSGKQAGDGFTSGFGGALKKLAIVAGGAIAAAGIGTFFKDSIKQASDLDESINAVNVAFGSSAKGIKDFGKTTSKTLGVSQVDFNNSAVRFSAFADKIAGPANDSSQFIADVATRASDFASVFNIDVDEALTVFQSGLSGEAEPLKRFGINLLDSEVKAYAMANGIGAVGGQLTETEKTQARYGLLMEQTAKVQGDFANTSDGLANSQRILGATFTDLQAKVGENLTPVMATFTAALVPLAENVFPKIADFVNLKIVPGLQNFAQYFSDLVLIGTTLGGDNVLTKIFRDVSGALSDMFSGAGIQDALTGLSEMRQKLFDSIMAALPGILDAILEFLPGFITFVATDLIPQLLEQLTGMATAILELFSEAFPKIADALIPVIPKLITAIAELLPVILNSLVLLIPEILETAISVFNSLVDALVTIIPQLLTTLIDLLPKILQSLISLIPALVAGAVLLFTAIVTAIPKIVPQLIKAVVELLPVIIDELINMLPILIEAAFELFVGLVEGLYKAMPDIIAAVITLAPSIIKTIIGFVPQLIETGIEIVKGLVKGIIDNGPRLLGAAIAGLADTAIKGFKALLGIQSPSKVFIEFGENIGQGLVNGIDSSVKGVQAAAAKLAKASVPSGFEWVMGPNGPSLVSTMLTQGNQELSAKQEASLSAMTATANLKAQGFNQADIDTILNRAIGGTASEIANSFNRGIELVNSKTNRVVQGNLPASEIAKLEAQGFVQTGKIAASQDELTKALDDLNQTIATGSVKSLLTPFANGGLVTGPTSALIGEAGPEVVIPLNRFENMMGMGGKGKSVNYYAAPNQSIDSEQDLFQAMRRAKVVAGW